MKLKMLCATAAISMAALTGCWGDNPPPTPPQKVDYGTNACGRPYTASAYTNQVLDQICQAGRLAETPPPVAPVPAGPTAPPPNSSPSGSSSDPCGLTDQDRDGVGDRCDMTDDRDNDGDGMNNTSDPYPNDYDNDSVSDGRDTTIGKDSDFDGTPDSYDSYPYDNDRD